MLIKVLFFYSCETQLESSRGEDDINDTVT